MLATVEAAVSSPVTSRRVDGVAVLEIGHPPVNALSHAVRSALLSAFIEVESDSAVVAVVITGRAGQGVRDACFVAGADIAEFDAPPKPPLLNEVLLHIEACEKPVIAAIDGAAFGGGFELALACHYRCATPESTFAFPEVKLGLLPGSGGTQRLPRLIPVQRALDLMLSGETLGSAEAGRLGIVDRQFSRSQLLARSIEYARQQVKQPIRRLRDAPIHSEGVSAEVFARYRAQAQALREPGSQSDIIRCVEAATTLPFLEGIALSRKLFEDRRESTPSRALRHLFFAERGSRAPQGAVPRPVARVGVVGAGTMGAGIAAAALMSGLQMTLMDERADALAAGVSRVTEVMQAAVRKGRLQAEQATSMLSQLRSTGDFDALVDAQVVIEAVFEDLAVKQAVFRELDAICAPDAVLASNTSTLDIDVIASATRRPEAVVGLHFFSPAHVMRLVEVVQGRATSANTLATALDLAKRLRKLGIVVGNGFGFVGNRMFYAYGRENQLMLLEGASPAEIDAALQAFGMAMGPNATADLAGLDVGYRARRQWSHRPNDPRYYRVSDLLVEAGRLGQKTGQGLFRYAAGSRAPLPDAEVERMIADEAARLGVKRRPIGAEEIVDRCILAVVNEGARLLEEGIARRSADIDAIWCNGYGFPRWRGGPLFYGDSIGLKSVLERVEAIARQPGLEYWSAAPLLERLALDGSSFGEWQSQRGEV